MPTPIAKPITTTTIAMGSNGNVASLDLL